MGSVDVVVPCYRYGRYLRQCVQSVLAQSGVAVRIRIIDDASPDDTAAIAAELVSLDSRVQSIRHDENRGHIATYNEGLAWASADYVLLLSADDFLLPGSLQASVRLLDSHPEAGFVFGRTIERLEGEPVAEQQGLHGERSRRTRIVPGRTFIETCGACNVVSTPTAVVRTALQKRVGGYRPDLPHSGDFEMWLRLAAHASVGFIDREQAVYRKHSANMSLHYTSDGWLPDLQQRKAAFEAFAESCRDVLPDADLVSAGLVDQLALVAVRRASSAFNEGRMEAVSNILDFARELSPTVRRSLPWLKLALKRQLGYGAWHAFTARARAR